MMAMIPSLSWAQFEVAVVDNALQIKFIDRGTWYEVWGIDGAFCVTSKVDKTSADGKKFEKDFKSKAKEPIKLNVKIVT